MDHNVYMDGDWKQQLDALHDGLVRRDDPTAWVTEMDAMDASQRYPDVAVRGPLFGVAALDPAAGPGWRLLKPVTEGMPQQARDALNSHLWFTAKDGTQDRAVRRELLAAVDVLEREPVDELKVLGVRYRVVRGDEFARTGPEGLEPPRPTDAEPPDISWDGLDDGPSPDPGHVLDPAHPAGLMAGALRLAMQDFTYTGARFPARVRRDSEQAVVTHPQVALLPVMFRVVENSGHGWSSHGSFMPTPHAARRLLYSALIETWPLMQSFGRREKELYERAGKQFRARGRADEMRVDGRRFRICRVERMIRCGPDGPEPPRPSDQDDYGPIKIHPTMDEEGALTYD